MLSLEVDGKLLDQRLFLIYRELKDARERLYKTNISTGNIAGNLVVCRAYSGYNAVCPFIDILINILNSLNYSVYLDIHIAIVLL